MGRKEVCEPEAVSGPQMVAAGAARREKGINQTLKKLGVCKGKEVEWPDKH